MIILQHTAVIIDYTNYKGERKERKIIPLGIEFISSEWHPEEQWILHAFDLDIHDTRGFAMLNIHSWKTAPSVQGVRELTPEEYEAKVAAGKKITFSKGGEH